MKKKRKKKIMVNDRKWGMTDNGKWQTVENGSIGTEGIWRMTERGEGREIIGDALNWPESMWINICTVFLLNGIH